MSINTSSLPCKQFRQAKTEIVSASKVAYRFLLGANSNAAASSDSSGISNRGTPRFQATWFKNLVSAPKSTESSGVEVRAGDSLLHGGQT